MCDNQSVNNATAIDLSELLEKIQALRESYAYIECLDQPQHGCTAYLYTDGTISEWQGNGVPESVYYQREGAPIAVASYRQQCDVGLPDSFVWQEATADQAKEAHAKWIDNYDREPNQNDYQLTITLADGTWMTFDGQFQVITREFMDGFEDAEWPALESEIREFLGEVAP